MRLVYNTLQNVDDSRRCWRTIGGVLVEKSVPLIKEELNLQIENVNKMIKNKD